MYNIGELSRFCGRLIVLAQQAAGWECNLPRSGWRLLQGLKWLGEGIEMSSAYLDIRMQIGFWAGRFYGAQNRLLDLMLGVSTRGHVSGEWSFDAGNCPYSGCEWLSVRRALKDLHPSRSDVFIDLG